MNFMHSDLAPKALGPYSQAVQTGNLIFCCGQIPLNPETMEIEGGTIEEQTERVIKNIHHVLATKHLSLTNVVKSNVYLSDMDNFKGMNEVYARMFNGHKPARTTFEVARLPLDCLLEIECIAEIKNQ